MVARAAVDRVFLFTVKHYSLLGTGAENECWSWGKPKFMRWLREGFLTPIEGEDGKPVFFPEKAVEWAKSEGSFWFRCRTLIGGVPLYALLPLEVAREVGMMLGVQLEDPRGQEDSA